MMTDKHLERIAALLRKGEDAAATPPERDLFVGKAREMMVRHGIPEATVRAYIARSIPRRRTFDDLFRDATRRQDTSRPGGGYHYQPPPPPPPRAEPRRSHARSTVNRDGWHVCPVCGTDKPVTQFPTRKAYTYETGENGGDYVRSFDRCRACVKARRR